MIKDFKKKIKKPLRQATLVFLIKDDKVLLAMKKRGFGKDWYNGVGGKPEKNESILKCAIRETFEEIGVKIQKPKKVAVLDFYFPYVPIKDNWNQQVMVYLCDKWTGKPTETEEMKPRWFPKTKLPFAKMWPDDPIWLPHVLAGKKIYAQFAFDDNHGYEDYTLKVLVSNDSIANQMLSSANGWE